MGSAQFAIILSTAAMLALVHTVIGVDHYVPFVVLGRAQGWSLRRLVAITAACGVGHVLSSVVLGLAGVALGATLDSLRGFEAVRGSLAAWLLIGFGLAYGAWGVWRALRGRAHEHVHVHADGTVHAHGHQHRGGHLHVHGREGGSTATVWALFIIFVFGPCEPLIPLMMAPSVSGDWMGLVAVVSLFGAVTIATMLALTVAGHYGLGLTPRVRLERYVHALAGLTLAASGALIVTLGI